MVVFRIMAQAPAVINLYTCATVLLEPGRGIRVCSITEALAGMRAAPLKRQRRAAALHSLAAQIALA